MLAIFGRMFEICEWLIERGADFDLIEEGRIGIPLISAVATNRIPMAQLLISQCEPRCKNNNAAREGREDVARLLISSGIDVNRRNEHALQAVTVLHIALGTKHEDVSMLLIDSGMDTTAEDDDDVWTALSIAA